MVYDHIKVEKKWQQYWEDNETFKTDVWDFSKPKFYALDMFPYPSGQGLHVGHPEGYTATDCIARMKRMQGYNVLHPMGFDSFGLPAEQYAIQTGNHPNSFTEANIKVFKEQLKMIGFSYDWDREVSTCDPQFYKWTQWIFTKLYEDGLVKYMDMPVNWCEELGTVLANDEIIDGKSERGGFPVVRKNMKQWVIDMPAYAQKLLDGLEDLDWPSSTKEMQRHWIGKSTGALITFSIVDHPDTFAVFTTRPDTLFGVTYCVLSPEHALVDKITVPTQKEAVEAYKKACAMKSEMERTDVSKAKTGVFTGAYALHPVTHENIPIYIADYVLSSYGTGAIMAVPAHDSRDFAFAKQFHIEIKQVIAGGDISKGAYEGDGKHIHSQFLDGMDKSSAIDTMIQWLSEHNCGKKKVNYRLRDWIFARQRYWGEPIPVVHLEDETIEVLDSSSLPLCLPTLEDYSPSTKGTSPLEKAGDWVHTNKGRRETSTMPGSAGSSWYYLRYIDPHNENELVDKRLADHWMPVDLYVGGPEHAVGHLLYARMWNQYLYDRGIIKHQEPFKKLVHQGMILGENGIKMGKRYPKYVVNPNDIVHTYGADTLRLYEMFMGPIEANKPWSSTGVEGSRRFIDRIWRLYTQEDKIQDEDNPKLEKIYHQTVKKVTEDYESLGFNTAISQLMIFINAVYKESVFPKQYADGFIKLINPITPHIAEEIWHTILHHTNTIAYDSWPIFDENKVQDQMIEMVVQVNGKVRGKMEVAVDLVQEEIEAKAFAIENVQAHIQNKDIKKVIVVKNKIINIVV